MARHFSEYDAFNVPPEFRPLGAWAYFGLTILFSIPLIGTIFLIVFCFSDANINRRNFARSYLIGFLVFAILFLVAYFTGILNEAIRNAGNGTWPEYLKFLPIVRGA